LSGRILIIHRHIKLDIRYKRDLTVTPTLSRARDYLSTLLRPGNLIRAAVAAVILIVLSLISTKDYLLFHGIIEFATIAIAWSIFILVWNSRRVITNTFFLIIGISFLFTGSIDLIHTLAYKGMGVFPGSTADLPTQLWIAARYFQSIAFLVAALFIGKSITKDRKYDVEVIFAVCTAACALLLASIFVWQDFPRCFIEGVGLTPFKIVSEYIISLLFTATAVIIYIRRRAFDTEVWQLLIFAQFFLILGELAFTTYASVYGITNMLGHLFKLISFYFFYRAIVVVGLTRPFDLLWFNIRQKETELEELNATLSDRVLERTREIENANLRLNEVIESQKQTEAALRESEDKFHTIADFAYDWVLWLGQDRKIIYCSPACERITGYPPEAFVEDPQLLELIVHPDDRVLAEEQNCTDWETYETRSFDFRIIHRDGSVRWISHASQPVMAKKGIPLGKRVSNRDITDRKHAEEALQQANKKINMLSSITRHDILNMIMVIRGYLQLSEDLVNNPVLLEYMKRENEAVDSIQRQIEFTRYYQDIGVKDPIWQDVEEIVRKVSQQLNLSGITVENHVSGLEIFADPLIEKVFYNLIENSLRHGEHVTTISFSYSETASGLIISYRDNGAGISIEDKEILFQKGVGTHTGLGLFLSREILSITGIAISENGEQGKGVNFEIIIPEGGYRFTAQD
jgi:PAS domain S-box-containing protein